MTSVYFATADATGAYVERASLEVARDQDAAAQGTISSFSRDNTLVYSNTVFVPVFTPRRVVQSLEQHVEVAEQEHEISFLPR